MKLAQSRFRTRILSRDSHGAVLRRTAHPVPALTLGAMLLCTAFSGRIWADPKLVSLRMMPQESTLHGKQASQQFLVIGKFADNRERDLTSQAHFALSNPAAARADESGRLFATADGATVVTATVGSLSAREAPIRSGLSASRAISSASSRAAAATQPDVMAESKARPDSSCPPTESIPRTTTSGSWKAVCSRS